MHFLVMLGIAIIGLITFTSCLVNRRDLDTNALNEATYPDTLNVNRFADDEHATMHQAIAFRFKKYHFDDYNEGSGWFKV